MGNEKTNLQSVSAAAQSPLGLHSLRAYTPPMNDGSFPM